MLAGVGAKLPCAGHLLYLRHSTVNSGDALNHPRQAFMTKFSFRMGLSVHARLAWLRAGLYLGWWALEPSLTAPEPCCLSEKAETSRQ